MNGGGTIQPTTLRHVQDMDTIVSCQDDSVLGPPSCPGEKMWRQKWFLRCGNLGSEWQGWNTGETDHSHCHRVGDEVGLIPRICDIVLFSWHWLQGASKLCNHCIEEKHQEGEKPVHRWDWVHTVEGTWRTQPHQSPPDHGWPGPTCLSGGSGLRPLWWHNQARNFNVLSLCFFQTHLIQPRQLLRELSELVKHTSPIKHEDALWKLLFFIFACVPVDHLSIFPLLVGRELIYNHNQLVKTLENLEPTHTSSEGYTQSYQWPNSSTPSYMPERNKILCLYKLLYPMSTVALFIIAQRWVSPSNEEINNAVYGVFIQKTIRKKKRIITS